MLIAAGDRRPLLAQVEIIVIGGVHARDRGQGCRRGTRLETVAPEATELGVLRIAVIVDQGEAHPASRDLFGGREALASLPLREACLQHPLETGLPGPGRHLDGEVLGPPALAVDRAVEFEGVDRRSCEHLEDEDVVADVAVGGSPGRGGRVIEHVDRSPAAVARRFHDRQRPLPECEQIRLLRQRPSREQGDPHAHRDDRSLELHSPPPAQLSVCMPRAGPISRWDILTFLAHVSKSTIGNGLSYAVGRGCS